MHQHKCITYVGYVVALQRLVADKSGIRLYMTSYVTSSDKI